MRSLPLLLALSIAASSAAHAAGTTGAQRQNLDGARRRPALPEAALSMTGRQALLYKGKAFARGLVPGAAAANDRIVRKLERALWSGTPVTRTTALTGHELSDFRAEKASMLVRLALHPDQVTEGFLEAGRSTVSGREIAARRIWVQTISARGNRKNQVYVPAPGFLESSTDYEEVVRQKLHEGYDVVTYDQQWAGRTRRPDGSRDQGGVDSAFGIGRDFAAVVAYASTLGKVHTAAISMGGLGALAAIDGAQRAGGTLELALGRGPNGEDLSGTHFALDQLANTRIIGGFAGTSRNVLNSLVRVGARTPVVRDLPLPATGIVPRLSSDPTQQTAHARNAARGDYRAKLRTMVAVDQDQAEIVRSLGASTLMTPIDFVHGANDQLARPSAIVRLADSLRKPGAAPVTTTWLRTQDHVYASSPSQRPAAFDTRF